MQKVALFIYTHSDASFIYRALIGQVNKYVKDIDIYFAYNENAPENIMKDIPVNWIKLTYNDNLIWTDRVKILMEKIENEYILFIHEDWLPIDDVKSDILEKVKEFIISVDCGFMMSYSHVHFTHKEGSAPYGLLNHPLHGTSIATGYPDYYYYPMGWHVFQPAIWKKSVLHEFCSKLKKMKTQNEDPECLRFMSTKNCWSVQNIKTVRTIRTMNSLIFPHMHALSEGGWNFIKYPTLKTLMESYGINTEDKWIHETWEIYTQ